MYKLGLMMFFAALTSFSGVQRIGLKQLQDSTAGNNSDTLYVVNFWATWCKPCVAEMPFFDKANNQFSRQKVKVVFVSLNSAKELEQVQKFITDKGVGAQVCLLDAGNPNGWIDAIDSSWSGAIPATAMYKKGKKVFWAEKEFTQNELDSIIKTKIN